MSRPGRPPLVGARPADTNRARPVLVRLVAVVLAFVLGLCVGGLGAFVHQTVVRIAGIPLPAGLVLALGAEVGLLVSTGLLLGNRLVILAPAVGWLLPVFVFAAPRPEGDLIITSAVVGYVFLLGGALLIGLALAVPYGPPPTRAGRAQGAAPEGPL